MKTAWLAMLAALGCAACSSDDDTGSGPPISDGPLAGVVGGKLWSFRSGETNPQQSQGDPRFWGEAYAEATAACSATPTLDFLILNVPREVGSYDLGFDLTATFVIQPSDNLGATKGRLVVEEITASSIRGGANIEFDPQNKVNGHFTLAICP